MIILDFLARYSAFWSRIMLRKITEFRFISRLPSAVKYPSWQSTRVISPSRLYSMSVQEDKVEHSQVLPVSQIFIECFKR